MTLLHHMLFTTQRLGLGTEAFPSENQGVRIDIFQLFE